MSGAISSTSILWLKEHRPDVYDKAVKTIKEMLKNLKNGRGDKVYNKERFEEYYSSEDHDDYY